MTATISEQLDALLASPPSASIVQAGDPVLRHRANAVNGQLSADQLTALVGYMRQTLRAVGGVGLAAVQIGIPLAVAIMEDAAEVDAAIADARERYPLPFTVLINPAVRPIGAQTRSFFEGCLSVTGWQAVRRRFHRVTLRAQDLAGRTFEQELLGWPARIAQHEVDHLNGELYLDRAQLRSLTSQADYEQLWAQPRPNKAATALGFDLT